MRRIVGHGLLIAGCALALGCSGGGGVSTSARAIVLPSGEPRQESLQLAKEDPPESSRLDLFGDPLPPHAIARVGTLRWWHSGDRNRSAHRSKPLVGNPSPVGCFALSPDGKVLASGGLDGSLQLWDAATGQRLRHFQGALPVSYLAFTPDGKTLVSAGRNGVVRLWDLRSGKERACLGECRWVHQRKRPDRPLGIQSVAVSPDGKLLAATNDTRGGRLLRVWQVATGEELGWSGKPLGVNEWCGDALAFGPDGKALFWYGTSEGPVRRWRADNGVELDPLPLRNPRGPGPYGFFPGAQYLAGSSGGAMFLRHGATGKEVIWYPTDNVTFSADGRKMAVVCRPGPVELWDLTTGQKAPHSFAHSVKHGGSVQSVFLSPDGKTLITGSVDGTIRVWDTSSGRCRPPVKERQGKVTHLLFSPDGKYLITAVHNGGALTLCDAATGKEVRALEPSPEPIHSLAFSPDGRLLATAGEGPDVRLLDTATGKLRQGWHPFRFPRPGLGNYVRATAVAFSPDGRALAAVADGSDVFVWDVVTGEPFRRFDAISEYGTVALSPDGRTLALADPYRVRFLNASTGEGAVWAGGTDRPFNRMMRDAVGQPATALSPDGKTLVSAGGRVVRVWEVSSDLEIRRFAGHRAEVYRVAFSPDGRAVASGSVDTTALIWDVTGRMKDGRLRGDRLSPEQAAALWRDLTDPGPSLPEPAPGNRMGDGEAIGPRSQAAARAHDALWALVAAPEQALPLLEDRLGRILAVKVPPAEPLIADLDSDDFATRARAEKELAQLGRHAEPALRKALAKQPPLEVRRRIERLLARLEDDTPLRRRLRAERVTQVLEQINTPRARRLLEHIALLGTDPDLTREAKAALSRLARRP